MTDADRHHHEPDETIIDPGLPIVDCHHHLWDGSHGRYLLPEFAERAKAFISALTRAGASVSIADTYRPPQRAYLMHWCCMVGGSGQDPHSVPPMPGVAIDWTLDLIFQKDFVQFQTVRAPSMSMHMPEMSMHMPELVHPADLSSREPEPVGAPR